MEDEPVQGDTTTPHVDPLEELQRDIDKFVQRFQIDFFPRWTNSDLAESDWGGKRQSEYKRLRNRHPDWDADAGVWREPQDGDASETEASAAPPPPIRRAFASFAELVEEVNGLAQRLGSGTGGAA